MTSVQVVETSVATNSLSQDYQHHPDDHITQTSKLIFFATLYGPDTEKALPLHNLLEILTVQNVYVLHLLIFTHLWHQKQLPEIFDDYFKYADNVHSYNTRYASKQNLHKSRVRTNIGKQKVSFSAIDHWSNLPTSLKSISPHSFPKKVKTHLLSSQLKT